LPEARGSPGAPHRSSRAPVRVSDGELLSPLPRVVWLLVVGRAVNRVGAFTLPFLAVALSAEFGATATTTGALLAVFGAFTLVSRLVGGWASDRLGPRGAIVFGLVSTAVAQLGVASAPSLWWAAVAIAGIGLAFEIYEPPCQALIGAVVPSAARPAAYGLLAAALAIAGIVGGVLGAVLGALDVRLLFVVDAATCLGCALLLALALPRGTGEEPDADHAGADTADVRPWRDRRLLGLLATGVVFAAVYWQVNATLGLTLDARGIPGTRVGVVLATSALTVVMAQPLLRRGPVARLSPWHAMAWGYVLLGSGFLANAIATTLPQFAAAAVVWSVGDVLLLGRAYALVADIAPRPALARYFAVYGLSWSVAAMVGPFAGTQLLEHAGPEGLWCISAIVCWALALAQRPLRRLVSG
jgi:MFS family permease